MVKKVIKGIPSEVKDAIEQIDCGAKVILFGSRARGDHRPDSDWDFLILTQKEASQQFQDTIRELLYELELKEEQVITSIIESETKWIQYQQSEFFKSVLREGIEIIYPTAA
jgi:uncharacterized protein